MSGEGAGDSDARWREFLQRPDQLAGQTTGLSDRVDELLELGQLILCALEEASRAGGTRPGAGPGSLLALVQKAIETYYDSRERYAETRRKGGSRA